MDLRASAPVGIFDSGVGGLSVLRAIRARFPNEHLIYLADQAHVPYGPRPMEDVRRFSEGITRYFMAHGVKLIVAACNTASAAALHHLRSLYPGFPFVGMEPAVKPAAEGTHSGVVGVLATPATFQGPLYASVVERFAAGVRVMQDTCPGLVQQIETGQLETPPTRAILEQALQPMLAQGADTIVLGCTHYPFVIPLIADIAGPDVRVIDPAPAVARQVGRILQAHGLQNPEAAPGDVRYLTTSDPRRLEQLLPLLLGENEKVAALRWTAGELRPPPQERSAGRTPNS